MRLSDLLPVFLIGASSFASAAPVDEKQESSRAGWCDNTPTSRQCWGNYNINTDSTYEWPITGVTRRYNFNIVNTTLAPDGVEKRMITVNGQYPGPTIEANWGDDVEIKVCNYLQTNGTGIHFHGVRQLFTNYADGVSSQTECPIAPGDCHTYKWRATQHGTGWYHSHYSIQYVDGLLGPIVVHGPSTSNWDIDLGPILMTDYYHDSVFEIAQRPLIKQLGVPPIAVNGLLNGKNVFKKGGKRLELNFTPGKKHLLRLVNTGAEVIFRFGIDNHKMTVIAMDWVPIKPYETKTLLLAVGQRYDVIVEADQEPGDYWMRAVPMLTCFAINRRAHNIRGIVRYDASSKEEPKPFKSITHAMIDTCKDEELRNLVPWNAHNVGESSITKSYNSLLLPFRNDSYALRWFVQKPEPYKPPKGNPVAKQLIDGVQSITPDYVPVDLTHIKGKQWVYIVIQSFLPLPHPLHLHGHDSYVIGRGGGLYLDSLFELELENPPRRDTVNLPQNGFVVIAFETDNPGSWLFHCHIEWHLHDGFAMTIMERSREEIREIYRGEENEMKRVCRNWAASGLETRS